MHALTDGSWKIWNTLHRTQKHVLETYYNLRKYSINDISNKFIFLTFST